MPEEIPIDVMGALRKAPLVEFTRHGHADYPEYGLACGHAGGRMVFARYRSGRIVLGTLEAKEEVRFINGVGLGDLVAKAYDDPRRHDDWVRIEYLDPEDQERVIRQVADFSAWRAAEFVKYATFNGARRIARNAALPVIVRIAAYPKIRTPRLRAKLEALVHSSAWPEGEARHEYMVGAAVVALAQIRAGQPLTDPDALPVIVQQQIALNAAGTYKLFDGSWMTEVRALHEAAGDTGIE